MLPVLLLSNSEKASFAEKEMSQLEERNRALGQWLLKILTLLYEISVLLHLVLATTEHCGCDSNPLLVTGDQSDQGLLMTTNQSETFNIYTVRYSQIQMYYFIMW